MSNVKPSLVPLDKAGVKCETVICYLIFGIRYLIFVAGVLKSN